MKKYTLLTGLFLTLLFNQESNAQVLYPNPSTGGGYSGYDGTHVSSDLNFTTGYSLYGNQMTLTTAGDLNIIGGTKGYKIGNNYVLWLSTSTNNVLTGVGPVPAKLCLVGK
ncbi:MAG TPA: hypothetical protein VK808_02455 [Bacteroidia bacterium]|nr:hypothetical protein [Bacteroidia bacterium]